MDGEFYPGCYRGVVEDVNDPEERFRYRVRVHHVHPNEIPPEHLPWAETIVDSAGSGFGDVPHYEVGDRVWVVFEGGDREFPCLIGGWIAAPGGISDLPVDQTGDYARTRRRWQRVDRKGNLIEISELPDENHVRLRSGDTEVRISQVDGSVEISATGPVTINAPKAEVVATEILAEADNMTLTANKRIGNIVGDGEINLFATKRVNICAANYPIPDAATLSEILLGRYMDAGGMYRQTKLLSVNPVAVEIGDKDGGPIATQTVDVEAHVRVALKSNTLVDVSAPVVDVTGSASVTIDGATEAKVKSATKVSIEAPLVVANGATKVEVKSSDVEVGLGGGNKVMLDTIIMKFNMHTHAYTVPQIPAAIQPGYTGAPPVSVPPVQYLPADATINTKAT